MTVTGTVWLHLAGLWQPGLFAIGFRLFDLRARGPLTGFYFFNFLLFTFFALYYVSGPPGFQCFGG